MDFRQLLSRHLDSDAELTIATIPVEKEPARGFGIMQTSQSGRITRFVEKPLHDSLLNELKMPAETLRDCGLPGDRDCYLASMGIYLFNRDAMAQSLDNDLLDFGRDGIVVIPKNAVIAARTVI